MNSFEQTALVSIGVPYFNAQKYIFYTLESIKNQTYTNIELILINDCSSDNSQQIVDDWLSLNRRCFTNVITLVNSENRGLAHSCKLLELASNGIYFSKLDSDDVILPNKISQQVAYLNTHDDIAMVYSNTLLIDSDGTLYHDDYYDQQNFSTVVNKVAPSGFVFKDLLLEDFIPNPSVLIRKEIIDKVDGYDKSLFNEDWDLWLRIAKDHKIHFMVGEFCKYRIHPESMMRRSESLVKVYKSSVKGLIKHLGMSEVYDKIIAKHLYTYVIGMYRYGLLDIKLLKLNFRYNRNFKSLLYYIMALFNIKLNQKKYY